MSEHLGPITLRLLLALAVGAAIGMERSFSGRPAGFRTHTLVCVSTSLLMLVIAYPSEWMASAADTRLVLDPTRMAQGIMTGIGFLGAGAIVKAGYSIHGLTTAASIWITAAIGILIGIGFYFPALIATLITLGVLSVFRRIEAKAPAISYLHCMVRFARSAVMSEGELRSLVTSHGFGISDLNYRMNSTGDYFEYRMVVRTTKSSKAQHLSEALAQLPSVKEFGISPTGD
ncbi:MAG TPA: MgtC/SapB family protein [Steroidobacteraceae bacterium]|nr:MgtC/SapB family protein [Steroidobacteraceae bacterium]